ncbi:MAG: hypothetical protein LJF04_18975, partial [Gemmatimonadetes bacterium]|nr:hypothetical protein [Gemmatimonadota bacterium]
QLEIEGEPGYEDWVSSGVAGPVNLADIQDFMFQVDFTVPDDAEPGIYSFQACVEADGASLGVCQDVQIVVYDPSAGFVTGGGWIDSPAGAYVLDPDLSGKATFGFVAKYKKGQSTPEGNTEFQFHAAGLNFHLSSYDWLTIAGKAFAMFKGVGTVNGEMCGVDDPYKFMLWAGDDFGGTPPGPFYYTFRIKIWCGEDDDIYDNGMNQEIGGGSIVVHTK